MDMDMDQMEFLFVAGEIWMRTFGGSDLYFYICFFYAMNS